MTRVRACVALISISMLGSSAQIVVRRGKPSDAAELAGVFRESWQLAYRGIIPHLHLESMIHRRGPDWWTSAIGSGESLLVLDVARSVVGYATFGPARTRSTVTRAQGEIYEIYLAPSYQGLGLGERLFEGCRHALDLRRLEGLLVWALSDNTGAIEFYWRRGGRPVAEAVERIGGAKLPKIAFVWN
jgi:ribosomal protein S18 acetylase RimI-like enzyme